MKRIMIGLCLVLMLLPIAPVFAAKERLVLMPLRVSDDDKNLQGAMETAVVEGLQQQYEVLSGEQVAKKARDIFNKESRNTANKGCDETRCMQGIAEAFQAELIATTSITKRDGGYFLALSIQNIFDNKVVHSKSLPCKNCDAFEVVEKLKELSGVSAPMVAVEPVATLASNSGDAETALWNEVQKGNSEDDYSVYLDAYPKGKFVALAKSRLKKLHDAGTNERGKQDQLAWDSATATATDAGYQNYLTQFPKGQFAALAQGRINKLKKQTVVVAKSDLKLNVDMAAIPAGRLRMGGKGGAALPVDETKNVQNWLWKSSNTATPELAAHDVQISAFKLSKTEITQAQWQAVMESNPSHFASCGANCPVEKVSWNDVQQFIQKLNQQTGLRYRLPSEAEWEYACRAGGSHAYCGGNDLEMVGFTASTGNRTHPVAQKQANAYGLYDMSGNVWEWVQDCYHDNFDGAPTDGAAWETGACQYRVLRGGSWLNGADKLSAVYRSWDGPSGRAHNYGFRLARD